MQKQNPNSPWNFRFAASLVGILLLCLLGSRLFRTELSGKNAENPHKNPTAENSSNHDNKSEEKTTEESTEESTEETAQQEYVIRVLLKTDGFQDIYHEAVSFSCDTDYFLIEEDTSLIEKKQAGEVCTLTELKPGSMFLVLPCSSQGKITLLTVNRSQGTPSYRGSLEIFSEERGFVLINELALEEYLRGVIPSEMPASYPKEALKAQAICARTYSYSYLPAPAYPEWNAHVDDSTAFQVYANIDEQEETSQAVAETAGEILWDEEGNAAQTYYYSTSCGVGTDALVWNRNTAEKLPYLNAVSISRNAAQVASSDLEALQREEVFAAFLETSFGDDFEKEEPWYRWRYEVESLKEDTLYQRMQERFTASPDLILTYDGEQYVSQSIRNTGAVTAIYVAKRGAGGIAEELCIETKGATYKIVKEYNIRYVLCDAKTEALKQDGTKTVMPTLLPSAFFIIKPIQKKQNVVGYTIIGGGFGHGVGMSQNAAGNMAEEGYTAAEILEFFYRGCHVEKVENHVSEIICDYQ